MTDLFYCVDMIIIKILLAALLLSMYHSTTYIVIGLAGLCVVLSVVNDLIRYGVRLLYILESHEVPERKS